MKASLFISCLLGLCAAAPAQQLLATNGSAGAVMLLDAHDGSIVDPLFIDAASAGCFAPYDAAVIHDEIWVTCSAGTPIFRFSLDGTTFLGLVGGARDVLRAITFAAGKTWATAQFFHPVSTVLEQLDFAGVVRTQTPAQVAGWSLLDIGDSLLMLGFNHIYRFDYDGQTLGTWAFGVESAQLARRACGNILFSRGTDIVEYEPSGTQVATYPVGLFDVIGLAELGNGSLLLSTPTAVYTFNGTTTILYPLPGVAHFTAYPGPGQNIGASYCGPAVPNSSGVPGRLDASGSVYVGDDIVRLTAFDLPPRRFGYFLASTTQGALQPPGSQGVLCLGGDVGRFSDQVQSSGAAGTIGIEVDTGHVPVNPPAPIQPGQSWNFQCWYRDLNPGVTSNFTDAVTVVFE